MTNSAKNEAKKVAVYVTKTGNRDVDIILGDQLVAGFSKSNKYLAIERTNGFLSQLSKEQGYQASGAVDDSDLARMGKQFGVNYVCLAQTVPFAGTYFISTRLVDVEKAEIVNTYDAEGKRLNTTKDVVAVSQEIAANLSGQMMATMSSSGNETFTMSSSGNETFTVNGVRFEMVYVEGGTFTMGATSEQGSDAESDEKPTHSVTLSDYYIGKFEVTQELWEAVMGSNPSKFKGDNLPVDYVSWDDCQKFITKLNSLTGKYFRLPTEAEWEYAARGGKKSTNAKYSGSSNVVHVAWFDGNSGRQTHPVGQLRANELGIYDMSGNVWEWCLDWYGSYSSASQTDPIGSSSGSSRVLRGGSWFNSAGYCRVSNRGNNTPGYRGYNDGFRLVLVP
ncbi:MAG: formylglycine-generating enzyme family protein [Bacteroidales bacterium]|nr:formylglycine-generating enzyme family protein [Bacteroidales bacterium]